MSKFEPFEDLDLEVDLEPEPSNQEDRAVRYEIVGKFSSGGTKYFPGDELPDLSDEALQSLLRKGVVKPLEE